MRTSAIVVGVLLNLCTLPAVSRADLVVSELMHVDPTWDLGRYWEFTVSNLTGSGVYMIAVGNNGADYISVRYPDLDGVWEPARISQDEWDTNEWGRRPTDWTVPDTSLYPFATEFPGYAQVLVYYVLGSNPPLGDGGVLTGLYFNYPEGSAAVRSAPTTGGAPFLVFGNAGEVVARGQTVGQPLPTRSTTWGGVKALYR